MNTDAVEHLQAAFLLLLPRIRRVARMHFRDVRCPDRREDCVCEAVALCWVWYVRLVRRGRDPAAFATALARYGALAVRSGRRTSGQERANDVLSPVCQRRRGFVVAALTPGSSLDGNEIDESLHDNTRTPIPEQVQFRCDFPAWVSSLPGSKRRLVGPLAGGHRATDVARAFGLSEGRISQLRKEFRYSYAAFCGDHFAG
jgi:DNA-directed RNA polymerase specialized sigma24 family protein